MMRKRSNSYGAIVGIAVLVGSLITQVQPGISKPGDVLNTLSSPRVGAPAQEKRNIGTGDLGYATRTGALQYGYNFLVAPGRLGLQPAISLAYSSQGSLRGGIASGWSMSIPMIELDTSQNRVLSMSSERGAAGLALLENEKDLRFVSSMSGGHRLVLVKEKVETGWTAFRSERDDQYIRYERNDAKGIWRARTLDGKTWYFGTGHEGELDSRDTDTASHDPAMHDGVPASLIFHSGDTTTPRVSPHHQPLTRVVDAFGNTIRYFWEADFPRNAEQTRFPEELRLHSIRYTENYAANLGSHAKVEFIYDDAAFCSQRPIDGELPIGASLDHRGFFPWYSGRRALRFVETFARTSNNGSFDRVRRVKLSVEHGERKCPSTGGAQRQLTAITLLDPEPPHEETAEQLQAPITFSYGPLERSFDSVKDFSLSPFRVPHGLIDHALSWGERKRWAMDPTLERSLLDMDGDGRLDALISSGGDDCEFIWRRNLGNGSFGPLNYLPFPDEGMLWRGGEQKPGQGEGCSLSARRTMWSNIGSTPDKPMDGNGKVGNHVLHRFIDMNRDGRPDLVTSIQYTDCLIMHDVADLNKVTEFDTTAPGITEVFQEKWDDEISHFGACNDFSPINVDSTIDNVCDQNSSLDTCGCAVLDQLSVDRFRQRVGPTECADFSEDSSGFNNNRTSEGGARWNSAVNSNTICRSYPLMRNGHYPWTVHYSDVDPNGELFFGEGERIWSPIPLDPATNESGLANNGGRGLSSANHAVLDITGDGIIDVITISTLVTATTVNGEFGRHWNVFPGEADPTTGKFLRFADVPYLWLIPEGAMISSSGGRLNEVDPPYYANSLTETTSMLVDTNADGLPDLIHRKADESGYEIALNTGRGFCVNRLGEVDGTVLRGESSIARIGYDNVGTKNIASGGQAAQWLGMSGEGKKFAGLVDVDGDGLPDYYDAGDGNVKLNPLRCDTDTCTTLKMGSGSGFLETRGALNYYIPRDIEVDGWDHSSDYWWQKSDFMDLDGDGLDDIATAKVGNRQTWQLRSEDTAAGKPLRLLNAIDNGQGLQTEIEYHPYNDAIAMSNSATGKGMPNHIWVATKITTHSTIHDDFFPAPDSEVTIKYGDPAYTKNHRGQFGFRGFESIQTSRAHDVDANFGFSVSEKRYDYGVDWSGRVSETLRYVDGFPYGSGSLVSAISSKEWSEYSLFVGASISFHSVSSKSYNCMDQGGGFVTETACGDSQLSGQQKSEMQMVADVGGDIYVAWVPVSTENFLLVQNEEGSKRSESDVVLFSKRKKYMMYTSEQRSYVREDDQWTLANRGTKRLDDTDTYVQFSGQYGTIDGSLTLWESKVTRDSVGQVTRTQDPQDFGTSFETVTAYSGLRVHPTMVTNEAGHKTRITIDHGTGQVTRALGANLLPCGTHKWEGVETNYDKLGRPTEVLRRSCAGDRYHLERVSTADYKEYNAPGQPVAKTPSHVIATTVLDVDAGHESVSTTYVDGAGRVLRTVFDLGLEKAETISHYSSAGQLLSHEEINPSTDPNDSSNFTETVYRYDSLGRAVDMRQGSNAGIGVDVSYGFSDGVSKQTTIEIVSDGGPAGEKIVHADHFGRLIRVQEKMDVKDGATVNTDGYANTYYGYDGNDNVAVITDAASVETQMFHDMAGRRVRVIRGEREWTYAYNKNGNMVKETSPNDLGESADIPGAGLYTTSTVYDELDRPTSRLLAVNQLSIDQQKMYEANGVEFVYDDCANGIGKLCSNTVGRALTKEYIYDWSGRVLEERQRMMLREMVVDFGDADTSPDFTMSRSSYFAYNTSGALTDAWMADGADQDSSTHLQYGYNRFTGAPETLSLLGTDSRGNPTVEEIALVTRNTAQRVVSQRTGCLIRDWDYDYLGRVTDTVVKGAGCTLQNGPILSESMWYFDSSEVSQHDVYRAGLPTHSFKYKYDSQHQLIEADDSDNYRVAFNYSPTGNGTMESVSGIDGVLLGRDPMIYTYGDGTLFDSSTSLGADKHAPVALAGFAKDLHYSYDFAGNVTQRTEITDPTGSPSQDEWSFSYDGISQQREVQLNNGTGGRELYYYDNGGQRYMAVTFANATDRFPERIRVWIGGAEIWYRPNSTGDGMEVDTAYAYLALGGINIGRVKTEGPVVSTEATFANGLSHVMGSVDWDTGVVNAAYIYGPYGEIVDSVGAEQDDHLRRFNGKESDQLSKLSYYGYRYYDKQSLSWTQADPLYLFVPDIGMNEPRRMSLYTFSLNNPIRYVDPDGRDTEKSETLPQSCSLFGFGCGIDKKKKSPGIDSGEDEDEEEEEDRDGESGDEDGEDKDLTSRADGEPEGTIDMVTVAIFEGMTSWGLIPAITVTVTPEQAKQIEGAGIVAFAFTGAVGAFRAGAKKAAKGIAKWFNKTKKKVRKKYASRVRARGVQDPKSHNFPYSFDDEILATKPIPKAKGYNIYQKRGSMTGKVVDITDDGGKIIGRKQLYKDGVFEIGVRSDGVIDHRFFRPD